MKLRSLIVFAILILLISTGCSNNPNKKQKIINNDITLVTDQLITYNSLVEYRGSAINPDEKYSKVLLIIDKKKITSKEFREMVQAYMSNIETYASKNDWEKEFKEYSFKFEELTNENKEPYVVAEKTPESNEITWNSDW